MLQRQLDHLAHLAQRVTEPAEVIVRHRRGALFFLLDELRQQLDLRLLRDLHDPARNGGDHAQPDLLQPERRLLEEHAEQVVGHAARLHLVALINRRRDDVAGDERPLEQGAAEHFARSDQAQVLLGGRELDPPRRLWLGLSHDDMIADADAGVAALETIEPDHVQPLVLRVRREGQRGSRPLARDLDYIALPQSEMLHRLAAQPRGPRTDILWLRARHLQLRAVLPLLRHLPPRLRFSWCDCRETREEQEPGAPAAACVCRSTRFVRPGTEAEGEAETGARAANMYAFQ